MVFIFVGFDRKLYKLCHQRHNGDKMVDKAVSTGKNVSIWLDDETENLLHREAEIQNISKAKIVKVALMRYSDEMALEREYLDALRDIRNKKYE